jgi:hypothetical protein
MKQFVGLSQVDVDNLVALAPVFAKHGPGVTDQFYETLAKYPITAKLIEGRVDQLKGTHAEWMGQLFAGDYGEAYCARRIRIGLAHVKINLPPYYVEGVMNFVRAKGLEAILAETNDQAVATARYTSLLKILDLDLLLINLAYGEERLDRISGITGMSRKLLENLVRYGNTKRQ